MTLFSSNVLWPGIDLELLSTTFELPQYPSWTSFTMFGECELFAAYLTGPIAQNVKQYVIAFDRTLNDT